MRLETVIFTLVGTMVIAFLLGTLTAPEAPEVPAAPPIEAVRAPIAQPDTTPPPAPEPLTAAQPAKPTKAPIAAAEATPAGSATSDPTGSPALGPVDAAVTVYVISDFQCPFCRRVGPVMKRLRREYGDQLRVIWKNNPLPFHDRAEPAARAALAAHRQGRFWEMHDLLFANPKAMSDDDFARFAGALQLDQTQFAKDFADPALAKQVLRERGAAEALDAAGTPSFFINGRLFQGAKGYGEFKAQIDRALAEADRARRDGVSSDALHASLVKHNNKKGEKLLGWFVRGEEPPKPKPGKRGQPISDAVWRVTVRPNDPSKGAADALVTVVEFSDFECPFCSKVNPTIARLLAEFPEDVRVVWKNNPLSFHKNAYRASEAAMAAHAQGKFWEMHDLLFANARKLQRSDLEGYAKQLGLDMARFRADLDAGAHRTHIDGDMQLAQLVNARGTPNLFINGRQAEGARGYGELLPVVKQEITKARALMRRGVSRTNVYNQTVLRGRTFKALADEVKTIALDGVPARGPANAAVTIVNYSDFQCPFSARARGPLEEIQRRFPRRVRIVYKQFPLNSIHKQAQLASEASLAAHRQRKFWEMHDRLYANPKGITRAAVDGWAEELGLDLARFRKDLDTGAHTQTVRHDILEGQKIGVRGTPSVFINGRRFKPAGGVSTAALQSVLAKEFGIK